MATTTFTLGEIASLVLLGLFSLLLVLLAVQTIKHHRPARTFLASLAFGVLGGISAVLSSEKVFPAVGAVPGLRTAFLALQLNFYGFQFAFFFVFLERLRSRTLNLAKFTFVLVHLVLQTVALWAIVAFREYQPATAILWVFADLGYNNLALFVTFACGVPAYYQMYQYTRERKPLLFMAALAILGTGFVILALKDYLGVAGDLPAWLAAISDLSEVLPALGIALFTLGYLSNVDYIYRLPFDVYNLMVMYHNGNAIHSVQFRTQRVVQFDQLIFAGMITAINSLFREVFKLDARTNIHTIASARYKVLIATGSHVSVMIVTERESYFLAQALKRYTRLFERTFCESLAQQSVDLSNFKTAERLLTPVFPFFEIERIGIFH